MNLRLYREHGSLNSKQVFDAFEEGAKKIGWSTSDPDGIPVIWSVLWAGRMSANKEIYFSARRLDRPVIIIEVGNLKRNVTWRISVNNINGTGEFYNKLNLDRDRPTKLGVSLKPINHNRRHEILIASQHQQSLQWQGMPAMDQWVASTIDEIKKHTDRDIIVRPHPRSPIRRSNSIPNIHLPRKVSGSYDDFDIDYNYHCVINFNSGPAVQSAINGTPVVCDKTSLAWPVSDKIENIEKIQLLDREQWFLELCHTEWTLDEIRKGLPLMRFLSLRT